MSKVALVRCETYEYNTVKAAVERGLELLGGPHMFARQGEKILLKPNLLVGEAPEKCVTTHPAVFKAVAGAFQKVGAVVSYGDSPGFLGPERAAKISGLADAASEMGIGMADFHEGKEIFFKEGIQNRKFIIAKGVLESDGLISLPKLKTHGLTRMTGCIKNQFGCIPGALKGEFHVKLPDVNDFSRMLVDLNNFIKPRLFIMDGIIAMEGNGPRGGNPKKMNMLLFSSDPVALDATVCRIINLNPEFVPTIKFGKEGGLGTYLENEIEIAGDDLKSFIDIYFNVKREPAAATGAWSSLKTFRNSFVPKPYIDKSKCIKCGVCVKMCPVNPKAVDWHDGVKGKPPSYKYERCIRCYCCQELCPESAIRLKVPPLRRLFSKNKH